MNIALPSISQALRLATAALPWVATAYVLPTGGLVLLGGRASDLLRRRVFLAGLVVFTAASLASGLAPTGGALIAARAAQGLGAALLTPAALSIITTTYTGAQRTAALSAWGAIGSGDAGAGVPAAGYQHGFAVAAAIAAALAVAALPAVPPVRTVPGVKAAVH